MTRVQRHRSAAALAQNNLCYYCRWPMWNGDDKSLPDYKRPYELTKRQARRLLCTAEHLTPKAEDGPDTTGNIVAACVVCNQRRAQSYASLSPADYKTVVEERVSKGDWHAASYRKVIGRQPAKPNAAPKRRPRKPAPKVNGHAHAAM